MMRNLTLKGLNLLCRSIYLILTTLMPKNDSLKMASSEELEAEHYHEYGVEFFTNNLKSFGLAGFQQVLEVGSGNGRWLMAFSSLGSRVFGVEPRMAGISQAKTHTARLNAKNVALMQGYAERIPAKSQSTDLYFSYGVLMYCSVTASLEEANRVLKKNGAFFIAIQGPGYPLVRLYHGLLARDYAQFEMAFGRCLTDIRAFLGKPLYDQAGTKSIPKKWITRRINQLNWTLEAEGGLEWRGMKTFLSFPIFYYVRGKKC